MGEGAERSIGIQIMHIREVVSKIYSPRGNLIKSETHEAESRVCFGFF